MSRGIGLLLAGLFVAGTLLCGAAALIVSWRTAGQRSAGLIFAGASLVVALPGGLFLGRGSPAAWRRGRR